MFYHLKKVCLPTKDGKHVWNQHLAVTLNIYHVALSIGPSVFLANERVERGLQLRARLGGRMVSQIMGKVSLKIIALRQCNPLSPAAKHTTALKNQKSHLHVEARCRWIIYGDWLHWNISSWHHLLPFSLLDKLLIDKIDSDGFFSRKLVYIDLVNCLVIAASFFMSCPLQYADLVWYTWPCCILHVCDWISILVVTLLHYNIIMCNTALLAQLAIIINPWHACAERVTVVVLCVCYQATYTL
jgi:hypothetical protein